MRSAVAAEVAGGSVEFYFHEGESFRVEKEAFSPFVLLSADAEIPGDIRIETLSGGGFFCRMAFFASFEEYNELLPQLKKLPGVMVFNSLLQQALTVSNCRLFENMEFDSLRQMQFTVESDGEKITAVKIADTSGKTEEFTGDEAQIIRSFSQAVTAFDPDVLTGFNCCREDLPLLTRRAKKLKIALECGRDGRGFTTKQSRYSAGEKQYSYQRFSLAGRHVVDLLHLVQLYDAAHRDLEDHDLISLQKYFALTGGSVPEILRELSKILLPAYFYRTRSLPLGFQESILRGSGSALDALLCAEYLRLRRAIPLSESPRPYAGAISSMEKAGVFHRVRHCDVRSLYPSLLLSFKENPCRDEAGIFLKKLDELRTFRLRAKDQAKSLPPGSARQQLESLQSSFKILINSFYGYLGFAQGAFNDYTLAEKVTAAGRNLLNKLISTLLENNAVVIEADTDGIYFQIPENDNNALDDALNAVLPPGIELEFDAEYSAMYSYKAKNYALLSPDGTIHLTGAALKSRSLEGFQRKFIFDIASGFLHNDPERAVRSYHFWKNAINDHTVALEDLAKSEILSDSPENYRKKLASGKGRRSAPYELALASGREFKAGDKVRFYMTGTKAKLPVVGNCRLLADNQGERDENTAWYLAKLDEIAGNFAVAGIQEQ